MKDIQLYEKVPLLENNFTVKFMEFYNSSYLTPHWHEHIELIYILSGSCNFTCNGKTFAAFENDFVVVNSTEIHSHIAQTGVSYFCVLIYPEFFRDVDFDSRTVFHNVIHGDEFIRQSIRKMYTEYAGSMPGSDMVLKGTAYQLMAYLMRNFTGRQLSDKDKGLRVAKLERINMILDYIQSHYQEKITTRDLAKLCYISEVHLCRFFRDNIGKSATDYINELRTEKAAVMLSNTSESVSAIAANTGFEDVNYFSRAFKKYKKESPSEYRKNHTFV